MDKFTKIDNSILDLIPKYDEKDIVVYMAILSVKIEDNPLMITNKRLAELSGVSINNISKCLNSLEHIGLIKREGKIILSVKHNSAKLKGNFTILDNNLLAEKIPAKAKLIYLKLVSLKPDLYGYVRIGQDKLSTLLNTTRQTIKANIDKLIDKGWIIEKTNSRGYNPYNLYKVKRVNWEKIQEEHRQQRRKELQEQYDYYKLKMENGKNFTDRELFEWFRCCLFIEKGEIYNKNNYGKDIGVLRNLLKQYDGNTIANIIESYVQHFDFTHRNYNRKTIKLHYLGADDIFNYEYRLYKHKKEEENKSDYGIDEESEVVYF